MAIRRRPVYPQARAGVKVAGSRLIPFMKLPPRYSGSPARMSGTRWRISSKIARSSARASEKPRQKCGPPPPKPTCGLGWRRMSNPEGSSKTRSSRFAEE